MGSMVEYPSNGGTTSAYLSIPTSDAGPPAVAHELEQQLQGQGLETDSKIYDNTQHGSFNDTRTEVYDAAAAGDAWQRTLVFFRKHLG